MYCTLYIVCDRNQRVLYSLLLGVVSVPVEAGGVAGEGVTCGDVWRVPWWRWEEEVELKGVQTIQEANSQIKASTDPWRSRWAGFLSGIYITIKSKGVVREVQFGVWSMGVATYAHPRETKLSQEGGGGGGANTTPLK